jgi:ATP-dependent DNA helicase 2 subunit 2
MIISQKTNDKASLALSSLIHALYELNSYAVARFVPKDNREPKMLLLTPNIEPDFECLYDIELPFAEDVRSYKFPPLDRVLTVSGKEVKVHRNLPSVDLLDAMSEYVDNMSLVEYADDDEKHEKPIDNAPIDDTFSPKLHRIQQVIKHRAVFPEADPPAPFPIIGKWSHPPEDLVVNAQQALDRVIEIGDIKKVPPKTKGKRWNRKAAPAPLSNLDVAALLANEPGRKGKGRRIDARNPIPEFKQVFEVGSDEEEIRDVCKQFASIIVDWIRHSVGDSKYGQAVEGILVMREELVDIEMPEIFNDFLMDLKKKVFGGELNGDRSFMWYKIRTGKLWLITSEEAQGSEVTAEESKAFMVPPQSKRADE